jgi:hypothetical protein
LIDQRNDSLKYWGVVLGVGVDNAFETCIGLGLVHVVLNQHDFIKYTENIGLCKLDTVKEDIDISLSKLVNKLLFTQGFEALRWTLGSINFLKVDIDNGCKNLMHTLLIGYIRIFFTPNKENSA